MYYITYYLVYVLKLHMYAVYLHDWEKLTPSYSNPPSRHTPSPCVWPLGPELAVEPEGRPGNIRAFAHAAEFPCVCLPIWARSDSRGLRVVWNLSYRLSGQKDNSWGGERQAFSLYSKRGARCESRMHSSPWLSLTLQEPAAALHSGPESLLVGVVPAWKPLLCSFDMPKCVVLRKKQNKEHLTWYKKGDQRPPKYFTRVVEK